MKVDQLIAASFTTTDAKAWRTFVPTSRQLDIVAKVGRDVLRHLRPIAAACVSMSVVYAAHLRRTAGIPSYVVAGSLRVGNVYVFGDGKAFDGRKVLSRSNSDWDGHAWVMVGNYLADVSIFRTVYSGKAHPVLTEHVRREFGDGHGLLICKHSAAPLSGLYYQPQYVLTEAQADEILLGAKWLFTGADAP